MTGGTAPRLTASDRRQRLRPGYRPAQGAIFVQVAEHLDADGLVQAAGAPGHWSWERHLLVAGARVRPKLAAIRVSGCHLILMIRLVR